MRAYRKPFGEFEGLSPFSGSISPEPVKVHEPILLVP